MEKYLKPKQILIAILIFTALARLIRIDFPNAYVFDEVYHAFTAKEYVLGHKEAWEYFASPPKGVAYEWTHPPLAKEIMAASMMIVHSMNAWAWRLPGVLLGILSVYLVYLIGKKLFKSEVPSLVSAFAFSIDGLNFVQSRTGMNDIYVITFMLVSLLFFINKKYFFSAVFLGLSFASKWSVVYVFPVYFLLLIIESILNKNIKTLANFLWFLVVPPILYLASYLPFFNSGFSFTQFKELQQQMWWYHTNLKATHDYASPWWSWPLNLYPVWYFVSYEGSNIGNIFASGNPLVFWSGAIAIVLTVWETIKPLTKKVNLKHFIESYYNQIVILLGYFAFWLPWAVSPRIMFLYHYSPSVPFMSLALGYQLNKLYSNPKDRNTFYLIIGLLLASFILIYPFLTGIPLTRNIMELFFYTNVTKNPFPNP